MYNKHLTNVYNIDTIWKILLISEEVFGSKQAIMKYNMTDESFYYKCDKSFERIGLTREAPEKTVVASECNHLMQSNILLPAVPITAPSETELTIEIPENALCFQPNGTAIITLKDKRQYTVSANAMMFFSRIRGFSA
jgi:hypothetical protein